MATLRVMLGPVFGDVSDAFPAATQLAALGPVKFVRLNIYPDGGVSRLRVIGKVVR